MTRRPPLEWLLGLALVACGDTAIEEATPLARPVTVIHLEDSAPPPGRLIPGIVTPYRQTEIPFEVTGRVESLIDIGDDVVGEQTNRDGDIVQAGAVLAELDAAPFQRALTQAEQRLASAQLELDAQVVQLEQVLPAQLRSAESQAKAADLNANYARDDVLAMESAVTLAETTLERNRELLPTGAVSDIAVRQSATELQAQRSRLAQARTLVTTREREHDATLAAIAEVEGSIALQRASNAAREATVKELEESISDARSDLENCVLRAPFPGRVTQQHVGEGSFVQAGSAVVTLTMMNPIEAAISVSANVEEQLVVGTDAMIYPTSEGSAALERGVRATLYQKRGVANTSTRTFEIGFIALNQKRAVHTRTHDGPSVPYVLPIFDNPLGLADAAGIYTIAEAVRTEGEESWVLRVRELAQGGRNAETLRGTLHAERVPVQLGERTIKVASFSLVQLVDSGSLNLGDLLVPSPTIEHEGGFVVDDNRWLLRPGDLVQVSVGHGESTRGFYVPVQAIREMNGATYVFVIDDNDRARAVAVEVAESSGEDRRIVSPKLSVGTAIAAKGVHFLQDGDTVVRTGAAR